MRITPNENRNHLLRLTSGVLVRYGVWGTLTRAARRLLGGSTKQCVHPFDETHGVETSGVIGGARLGVGHRNDDFITAYAGVAPSRFRAALDFWERSLKGQPTN